MPDQLEKILLILEIFHLRKTQQIHSNTNSVDPNIDWDKFYATQAWYDEQIAEREAKLGLKP